MNKVLYLIAILLCAHQISSAQIAVKSIDNSSIQELPRMSSYDSIKLSQLPVFKLPEEATRRLLPYAIDNSAYPWFRPLIAQVGLECGQASSIGIVFTYEMNYLRDVPGNLPENQYATHFAYDFVNGGTDAGVSFFETYEILKQAGNPTVADYGGMSMGGPSRWMSGYDLYYNAMHNRVTEVYSIKVNTAEGIQTLKNWIYDHGNGSSAGGLGCFYAQFTHPPVVFAPGTPEEGKHVIYSWGNSPNHSMSIVGYNDSIRWDYNGDGQYTNNIDLNFDGILDARDWEIGGFKMANTYGSINGWGDNGFAYMMYKSVADKWQQGGIWNNTVVVIDVQEYEPQLTAKVSLSYDCRNLIRVMAGVSTDPNATEPEHILHYPIFDFQGGCNPMQGTSGPSTIEFGLDLNLLLQYVNPGEEVKYFIMVQENDPFSSQSGTLESFAIIDYTNGGIPINSLVSEVILVNDNITMASVNATVNHNPVIITSDTIPPIPLYSNYAYQIQASQGTSPYRWHLVEDYMQFDSTAVMTLIDSVKLQPSSTSNGKAKVVLPFDFPFFGEVFNELYVTVAGYLMFENSLVPWPFYIEGRTYFIQTPMIAPVMSHPLVIASSDDGIWYEPSDGYVTFRWKLTVVNTPGTCINATARLYADGKIEITYGDCVLPSYVERYAGISQGNGQNYEIMTYDPDFTPFTGQFLRYTPTANHPGITLSTDGTISGQTYDQISDMPVTVCVTDKHNLKDYQTYYITTQGLLMEYTIEAGDDNVVGFGENVSVNLDVTNLNNFAIGATTYNFSTFDPYFTIINGQVNTGGLLPGETISIDSAFLISAHNGVPNEHLSPFQLTATSGEGEWSRIVNLTAYRPVTDIASINVVDGNNGILEPGETVLIAIDIMNAGGAELTNALGVISSYEPYLNIYLSSVTIDTLETGDVWHMVYGVMLESEAPVSQLLEINLTITGDHGFYYLKTIPFYTGILAEDFETGDLSAYEWITEGNNSWTVEEGSAYEGDWCARSGLIIDNQMSLLSLVWDVAFSDSISFYFKVSSEANYDFLYFFSGPVEMAKWAGNINWTKASFMVPAGEQTFLWKYMKDYSISSGEDCARIDYIVFPAFAVETPSGEAPVLTDRLFIYPNPGRDELNVKYTIKNPSNVKILIIDMNGKTLYNFSSGNAIQQGEYVLKPDLKNQKPGVYTILMITENGVLAKKLIRTQ